MYDLFKSWSRMVPELLRYSDKPEQIDKFGKELQTCFGSHNNAARKRKTSPLKTRDDATASMFELWQDDSWAVNETLDEGAHLDSQTDFEEGDALLAEAGLLF